MRIGDVNPLIGRSFVAKSFNTCRIIRLGPGAVRAHWQHEPTDEDVQDLEAWIEGIVGPLAAEHSRGIEQESENYSRWKRKQ